MTQSKYAQERAIATDTPKESKKGKIPVTELFGPTIQGEGILTGAPTHFLRTGGCPLHCEWCDSLHSVEPDQIKERATWMTPSDILGAINALPYAPYVTFTGGDPCMHKALGEIIYSLNHAQMYVAIETQGTLFPDWLQHADVITFSPKPPSSGNEVDISSIIQYLEAKPEHQRICIKIVCSTPEDIQYALDVYNRIHPKYYEGFWFNSCTEVAAPGEQVDPIGRAMKTLHGYRTLTEFLLQSGEHFNNRTHIGCQQHVLVWPEAIDGV